VDDLVPPALAVPFPSLQDTVIVSLVVVQKNRSTERKYVEERIVAEDVDGRIMWAAIRGPPLFTI
jgi:hypothetical protein